MIVNRIDTIKPNKKLIIIGSQKIKGSNVERKLSLIKVFNKKGIEIPAIKAGIMLIKNIITTQIIRILIRILAEFII
jgi:hypothetical protein